MTNMSAYCGTGKYHCAACDTKWTSTIFESDRRTSECRNCAGILAPSQFKPYKGRTFGYFKCNDCGNKWRSAYAWHNFGQECLQCSSNNYAHPYKTTRLLCPECQQFPCKCPIDVHVTGDYYCETCDTKWTNETILEFEGNVNLETLIINVEDGEYPACHRQCRRCRDWIIPEVTDIKKVPDFDKPHERDLCEKCQYYGALCYSVYEPNDDEWYDEENNDDNDDEYEDGYDDGFGDGFGDGFDEYGFDDEFGDGFGDDGGYIDFDGYGDDNFGYDTYDKDRYYDEYDEEAYDNNDGYYE